MQRCKFLPVVPRFMMQSPVSHCR